MWSDFLLLLEGQTVNLPPPKNKFATDLLIYSSNNLAILAASKSPIKNVEKFNMQDGREIHMMASRWQMFSFNNQIENPHVINPCPSCFAEFILLGGEPEELQC